MYLFVIISIYYESNISFWELHFRISSSLQIRLCVNQLIKDLQIEMHLRIVYLRNVLATFCQLRSPMVILLLFFGSPLAFFVPIKIFSCASSLLPKQELMIMLLGTQLSLKVIMNQ